MASVDPTPAPLVKEKNAYSASLSPERRRKYLARKLEEVKNILALNDREQQRVDAEMFFHKLRGTAATFDFLELDTLAVKASSFKGRSDELQKCLVECEKQIEKTEAEISLTV